jgi:hypothetical protein
MEIRISRVLVQVTLDCTYIAQRYTKKYIAATLSLAEILVHISMHIDETRGLSN